MKTPLKISIILLLLGSACVFYFSGTAEMLNLSNLQQQQTHWQTLYTQQKSLFVISFFIAYVIMTALSMPAASLLTLLAGALFGFSLGLTVVSFASTLGATLAFWLARFLFADTLQARFKQQLPKFHDNFSKEGAFYLFALRLVPVFPFFMVNALMGLSPIRSWTYYWVSQLGMLPGTIVFVYAGTELAKIKQLSDISSPSLWVAFAILGLLPLISKKCVEYYRQRSLNNAL